MFKILSSGCGAESGPLNGVVVRWMPPVTRKRRSSFFILWLDFYWMTWTAEIGRFTRGYEEEVIGIWREEVNWKWGRFFPRNVSSSSPVDIVQKMTSSWTANGNKYYGYSTLSPTSQARP
ncbi:hypothetical protein LWI28_011846 [Acer negundo]|uniref:Uncharacterized protein n=1 Tax=Acer negundo TaxID=4023 RepID=A0AAD5IPU3_ACENE|nr:hypothetical protein LWI28_011846 [Acer negundo]KAK4844826.1 hypothetical protein QYF36_024815 [Acer negundo]